MNKQFPSTEPCHAHGGALSCMWWSLVTHVVEPCHVCGSALSGTKWSLVMHVVEPCHTRGEAMSCMWWNLVMHRIEPVHDVGFPSVCCEYVLLSMVNKECALGLQQCRIEQGGNSKQRQRREQSRVRETPCRCQRR